VHIWAAAIGPAVVLACAMPLLHGCAHNRLLPRSQPEETTMAVRMQDAFPQLRVIAGEHLSYFDYEGYDYEPVNILELCADMYHAVSWDDGDCDARNGPLLTPNDCRLTDFMAVALAFENAARTLAGIGYPKQRVSQWTIAAQRRLLSRLQYKMKDVVHETHAAIQTLADQANAYRASASKYLPKVSAISPECGGPLMRTRFEGVGLSKIYLIPSGYYRICKEVFHVDPNDLDACENWREAAPGSWHSVSGVYHYRAEWDDGQVTRSRIDFDYSGHCGGDEFITPIPRRLAGQEGRL